MGSALTEWEQRLSRITMRCPTCLGTGWVKDPDGPCPKCGQEGCVSGQRKVRHKQIMRLKAVLKEQRKEAENES